MWLGKLPNDNDKTVGLLKNYHVSKKLTWTNLVNTNKKGRSDYFYCGDPNHWYYKCSQLFEKERYKLSATKDKGGLIQKQVSEVVDDNKDS